MPIIFYIIFSLYLNHIKTFLCFEYKEFIPIAILSPGNICGIKFRIENVSLVNPLNASVSTIKKPVD